MANWLKACRIDTVVMESTGVYWIPILQILERAGLTVKLVNARQAENLPGRKTDLRDCQWLQQLHTCGLLTGSFRRSDDICACATNTPAPSPGMCSAFRKRSSK